MTSLTEYRAMLERIEGGTIPAALGLEIIHTAEAELREARGEFTLSQAVARSGKSRSYFERRLERWKAQGFARKPGRDWLIKAVVIPDPMADNGVDPALEADEVADLIWRRAS